MIGTSLGPYKILEQLGAGGMGEVYLGEDTRLGRKVAIKLLPAEFASDPERLARFFGLPERTRGADRNVLMIRLVEYDIKTS